MLSSCFCRPRDARYLALVEKVDSITLPSYSDSLYQTPSNSGTLLSDTLAKKLLGAILYQHSEAQNKEVRLTGVAEPYFQILVCVFNIKDIGFEYETNESFLVTYGCDGKIKDALYLGINETKPTRVMFSFKSKRHIPSEDIPRSKWIYYKQKNKLKLEVFEENSWLDQKQNPCLDNYFHTFPYQIDEQGRIVRLCNEKMVPYKYNTTDHSNDSCLEFYHKRFSLQFIPYSEGKTMQMKEKI